MPLSSSCVGVPLYCSAHTRIESLCELYVADMAVLPLNGPGCSVADRKRVKGNVRPPAQRGRAGRPIPRQRERNRGLRTQVSLATEPRNLKQKIKQFTQRTWSTTSQLRASSQLRLTLLLCPWGTSHHPACEYSTTTKLLSFNFEIRKQEYVLHAHPNTPTHLRARTPARPHVRTPARPHARTHARPHARASVHLGTHAPLHSHTPILSDTRAPTCPFSHAPSHPRTHAPTDHADTQNRTPAQTPTPTFAHALPPTRPPAIFLSNTCFKISSVCSFLTMFFLFLKLKQCKIIINLKNKFSRTPDGAFKILFLF